MPPAILFGLVFAPLLGAQSTNPLDHVTALMRDYARGVMEFRFDVQARLRDFDHTGKLLSAKNTAHIMEFTKGRYRGEDPSADSDWSGTLQVTKAARRTLGLQTYTDLGVWDPVFVFSPGARKGSEFTYRISAAASEGAMTVSYKSAKTCSTFAPAGNEFKFTESQCGSGQAILDERASIPLRTTFEALGLPLTFGKEVLKEYRNDADYRMATVAGAKQPFLVPAKATATLVFDLHKIVVECVYTLHPGRK